MLRLIVNFEDMQREIARMNEISDDYRYLYGSLLNRVDESSLHWKGKDQEAFISRIHAFEGDFEGWKYGPVSREVRNNFYNGEIVVPTNEISENLQYIVNNVILEYGSLAAWKLSELSHRDVSWKNARRGLAEDDVGHVLLSIEDIKVDAAKVRPYDHVWDMYYDEFEDEVTVN